MPQLPLHSNRVESALREMRAVGVTEGREKLAWGIQTD